MSAAGSVRDLAVGTEIEGPVKVVTSERIEWYDSAMLSAASGELRQVTVNIHTDDSFAKEEGLPGVIADGMISTNWCSSMMLTTFGMDYLERGELRTKFIKPIFLGQKVRVKGKVVSAERQASGSTKYEVEVWCEVDGGVKVTVGDAKVEVAAPA